MAKIEVIGVIWEDAEELSSVVSLEIESNELLGMSEEELEDFISDELSNIYGFCHFGWESHRIEASFNKKTA